MNRPLRILFLLTQDILSPSGLGRYFPLAKALSSRGHHTMIAALHSDFASLTEKEFVQDGVNIHYVAQMHVHKSGNNKTYFSLPKLAWVVANGTFRLTATAFHERFDIIHIGKPHPMNSIAGLLASSVNKNTKVFLDCDDYEIGVNRFQHSWQQKGIGVFENWVPHHVDHITTNTHFNQNRLQMLGIPPEKITYLPNGIDLSRFIEPDPTILETKRQSLGLSDKKVISFIGSISLPGHPVDILLHAFTKILQQIPNAVLLLVGGGEDIDVVKAMAMRLGIADKIVFTGRVAPDDVVYYYHLSDVTVDPVYDNAAAKGRCPLKLFEAWACGTPFVTSDVGDRKLLIGNPPAGMLSEPGNTLSLSKSIINILSIKPTSIALITEGKKKIPLFHWHILARKLEDTYFSATDYHLAVNNNDGHD